MRESRPWDDTDARLFQLQEKINTYLSFALDGEMAEAYPEFEGKKVRLQIECPAPPGGRTLQFIEIVRKQIAFQEIRLVIKRVKTRSCASEPGGHHE
jgi:hypothetical protein